MIYRTMKPTESDAERAARLAGELVSARTQTRYASIACLVLIFSFIAVGVFFRPPEEPTVEALATCRADLARTDALLDTCVGNTTEALKAAETWRALSRRFEAVAGECLTLTPPRRRGLVRR